MKIDTYVSATRRIYRLVVPTGTDLATLKGVAGKAVASMSPLTLHAKDATLSDLFRGDLLAYLEQQLATFGAGLVKTEVQFSEVVDN